MTIPICSQSRSEPTQRHYAAALKCCHLIHTSSTTLGQVLHQHNPYNVVVECDQLDSRAKSRQTPASLVSTNFYRQSEPRVRSSAVAEGLLQWCERDPRIRLVIVQIKNWPKPCRLNRCSPPCPYPRFRKLMSSAPGTAPTQSIRGKCLQNSNQMDGSSCRVCCLHWRTELYASAFNAGERGIGYRICNPW